MPWKGSIAMPQSWRGSRVEPRPLERNARAIRTGWKVGLGQTVLYGRDGTAAKESRMTKILTSMLVLAVTLSLTPRDSQAERVWALWRRSLKLTPDTLFTELKKPWTLGLTTTTQSECTASMQRVVTDLARGLRAFPDGTVTQVDTTATEGKIILKLHDGTGIINEFWCLPDTLNPNNDAQ